MQKKKIIRLTTADISLNFFLKGQLQYLNQYFDIVGVAKDTGCLNEVAEREGIRVIDAPLEREISLGKDIKGLWFLYKLFRKEKPWCVHANTPKGSLLAMIAAKLAGVPSRIYTVTGLRYQGAQGKLRLILKTMERITCFCATKVVPEGQGVLHALHKDHITAKLLSVVWNGNINGIDTAYYSKSALDENIDYREQLGYTKDDFVFVFVGRIVKDKGMNELAECMKRLGNESFENGRKPKLLVVGTFEEGDPVAEETKKYFENSDDIKMVGWQTDVRPFLAASDAMVFPSYREGFPNTPLQAGAFHVPCIVTNINGSNEIIKDGLNGRIIAAPLDERGNHVNDITDSLYSTMYWFVSHPADVARMSKNARPMICERYEQKDVWKALLDIYKD